MKWRKKHGGDETGWKTLSFCNPMSCAIHGDGQSDAPFDIDPQFTTLDLLASRAGCIIRLRP